MSEERSDRFRTLFMCTGNQARSVIGEHYFRRITGGLPVEVESVGTMDIQRAPALPEAIEAAKGLDLDLSAHASRCYTAVDLSQIDLVIGFEQNHVATAVVEGRAIPSKTFKLLELARLLEALRLDLAASDPVARAREVIKAADAARDAARFTPGEDLADPAGRKESVFRDTAAAVKKACDVVVSHLFMKEGVSGVRPDSGVANGARIWD